MDHTIADELRTLRLGHGSCERRAIKILEDLTAHPGQTIPQASADWAGTKAAYRWLDSKHSDPQALRSALVDATVRRCNGQGRILVAQDTTSLDFTSHPQTRDLGPLESSHCRCLLSHSALALTVEGVPLGLLHQKVWARDEATGPH